MKRLLFASALIMALMSTAFASKAKEYYDQGMKSYNSGRYDKAAKLFEKACKGGYTQGCYNLGVFYANGRGVRQDYHKAKLLFGKSCDMGDENGCRNYAILNKRGY